MQTINMQRLTMATLLLARILIKSRKGKKVRGDRKEIAHIALFFTQSQQKTYVTTILDNKHETLLILWELIDFSRGPFLLNKGKQ